MTLGIGLRQGPREVRFLVSEVPLYIIFRGGSEVEGVEFGERGSEDRAESIDCRRV